MLVLSLIIIYLAMQLQHVGDEGGIRIRMQKIEAFEPTQETSARYIQRVKIHFAANDIEADKQKFVFLNALSRKHYTLLANLLSLEQPDSKSFDQLVNALSSTSNQRHQLSLLSTLSIAKLRKLVKMLLNLWPTSRS